MSYETVPARAAVAPRIALPRVTLARTFLLAVGISMVAAAVGPVEDPDFWWHLKTGQWIWAHGGLPRQDLFTHTVAAHAWVTHEWLSELLIAALFWIGRLPGVSIGLGAVTLAGYFLIYRRIDRRQIGFVAAGLATALGVFAGGPVWGPRVQMITFALTALLLLWIRRFCEGRGRALYFLPLLIAGWANLHAGFVVAFGFLGLALVAELIRFALRRPGALEARRLRHLGLISVAGLAAALVNPNTYNIYAYPFQTQVSQVQQRLIVEWFSPNFHNGDLRLYELMIFAIVVLLPFARRISLREFLFFVASLALSLQSVRHIALFVAGSTPLLAQLMQDAWERALAARGWRWRWVEPRFAGAGLVNLLLLAGVMAVVFSFAGLRVLPRQVDGYAVRKDFPVAAADFVARTHPPGQMFNEYGWGGYLVWRLYPDYPVFIFGDAALMGDAFLGEYAEVEAPQLHFEKVLAKYEVSWVIFRSSGVLITTLGESPRWAPVYRDQTATILMRRTPATSDYLAAHTLP